MAQQTFREKAEAWQGAAPQRAARRAKESALRRLTGRLLGLAVLALIVFLLAALVAAIIATWTPIALVLGVVAALYVTAKLKG